MLNKAKAALLLSVAFLHVNDEPTSADPVARYVDDRNPGNATLVIHSCMVGNPEVDCPLVSVSGIQKRAKRSTLSEQRSNTPRAVW